MKKETKEMYLLLNTENSGIDELDDLSYEYVHKQMNTMSFHLLFN